MNFFGRGNRPYFTENDENGINFEPIGLSMEVKICGYLIRRFLKGVLIFIILALLGVISIPYLKKVDDSLVMILVDYFACVGIAFALFLVIKIVGFLKFKFKEKCVISVTVVGDFRIHTFYSKDSYCVEEAQSNNRDIYYHIVTCEDRKTGYRSDFIVSEKRYKKCEPGDSFDIVVCGSRTETLFLKSFSSYMVDRQTELMYY